MFAINSFLFGRDIIEKAFCESGEFDNECQFHSILAMPFTLIHFRVHFLTSADIAALKLLCVCDVTWRLTILVSGDTRFVSCFLESSILIMWYLSYHVVMGFKLGFPSYLYVNLLNFRDLYGILIHLFLIQFPGIHRVILFNISTRSRVLLSSFS